MFSPIWANWSLLRSRFSSSRREYSLTVKKDSCVHERASAAGCCRTSSRTTHRRPSEVGRRLTTTPEGALIPSSALGRAISFLSVPYNVLVNGRPLLAGPFHLELGDRKST